MKPTKEQLADPKWWDEKTNKDLDFCYCYWNFQLGVWFSKGPIIGKNFELLAKRPGPEVLETDWLKEGVNVTTPKGIAEVRRITEDNGVYTSLGNFCRSELSEVKSEWKPEVGDCEVKLGKSWVKCKVDYICDQYIVVLMHGSNTYEALVRGHYELRPIKTQREEFIEEAKSRIKNMDADDIILAGKLYDAGCRFNLTEKDGE